MFGKPPPPPPAPPSPWDHAKNKVVVGTDRTGKDGHFGHGWFKSHNLHASLHDNDNRDVGGHPPHAASRRSGGDGVVSMKGAGDGGKNGASRDGLGRWLDSHHPDVSMHVCV